MSLFAELTQPVEDLIEKLRRRPALPGRLVGPSIEETIAAMSSNDQKRIVDNLHTVAFALGIDTKAFAQSVQQVADKMAAVGRQHARFQRAVDLWDSRLKLNPQTGVFVAAIDAAWRDDQLDEVELRGLFESIGYALPANVAISRIEGFGMKPITPDASGPVYPILLTAAGSDYLSGTIFRVEDIDTPAKRAAEHRRPLTLEEADAAFDGIGEL